MRTHHVLNCLRGGALLLATAIACSAALPSAASAGRYEVFDACKRAGNAFGIRPTTPTSFGFAFQDRCQPTLDGGIALSAGSDSLGGLEWEIAAPPDTTIRGVDYERVFSRFGDNEYLWELNEIRGGQRNRSIEGAMAVPVAQAGRVSHREDQLLATAITGILRCRIISTGCHDTRPDPVRVAASEFTLVLEDVPLPQFTAISGSLFSDEPVGGTRSVTYSAEDKGSGIASTLLIVDGVEKAEVRDQNGGKCVAPFLDMVPCSLAVSSSFQLDTTKLADGEHEVQLALIDASGNRRELQPPFLFFVDNRPIIDPPSNAKSPEISGPAEVGGTLRATKGEWEGAPAAFSYRWLRCPEAAERLSECGPIAGATAPEYTLGREDLRSRALVEVTATNESGSESAFSDATALVEESVDETPPTLRGTRLSRKAFRIAKGRTALAAAAKGARGTVLKFSSSEAGRLSIAIARSGKGSAKLLAVLRRQIRAGAGKVALSGRIGRRALRPGRYLLGVSVTDAAGNASKPAVLSFKVLAG